MAIKLILCWVTYFVIHSLFASDRIKVTFKRYIPKLNIYYRAIFNFFATIGLLVILIYQSTFPQKFFYVPGTGITFLGLGLAALGLMVIKESFIQYDIMEFLGIRQLNGNPKEGPFRRQGLLEYIRHPLYSGSILLLIGYLIFVPGTLNLITVLCMILYLVIGSWFEEKKLIKIFGKEYINYKKEVPAFIPSLQILLKKSRKPKN